jgi:hypothetical protein
MAELNWSDVQEQLVKDAVNKAFTEASVAMRMFRKPVGPVPGGTELVRNERIEVQISDDGPPTVRLNSFHDAVNLRLVNLSINVELTSEQVADESLSNALFSFRRAASTLALEQDRVVFAGYGRGFVNENSAFVVNQVDPQKGLADLPARYGFTGISGPPGVSLGQLIIRAIVDATKQLTGDSQPAPFACVLGSDLYGAVNDPSPSLVFPADRLPALMRLNSDGGVVEESRHIDRQTGIVVSLGGNAVDLVIGTPPTVQYLQRLPNARFLFRVYMRSTLRIRDDVTPPVAGFRVLPTAARYAVEAARVRALRGL